MANKGFNLIITETKEQLLGTINNSGLPLAVIDLTLKELQTLVEKQLTMQIEEERRIYSETIMKEQEEYQKTQVVPTEEIDIIEPNS